MYYLIPLLLTFLFSSVSLNGQIYEISKGSTQIDGELRSAVHVTLEPKGKETSKAFRSFLKDKYDIKLGWLGWKNRDAEEVKWSLITDNKDLTTVYTQFKDLSEGSEFYIIIEQGDNNFISFKNNEEAYKSLKKVAEEFLSRYLPQYLSEKIDKINKQISSLDSDLKDARKNLSKNKNQIKENEKEIEELKEENYSMKKENTQYQNTINEKESAVEEKNKVLFEERQKLEKTKAKLIKGLELK